MACKFTRPDSQFWWIKYRNEEGDMARFSKNFCLTPKRHQRHVHGELFIDSRLEVCLDVQPLLCSDMNVG
jgi:hypothetical protein